MSKTIRMSASFARVLAALCALMLTACLTAALFSVIGIQTLTSSGLHERAALAGDVVDLQMNEIHEKVTALGQEYGFDPQDLISLIKREEVEQLDREMVRWWTGSMASGKLGEMPVFSLAGGEEALMADTGFIAGLEELMIRTMVDRALLRAEQIVQSSAVQFREVLIETGIKAVQGRVNLPQAMSLLQRIPSISALAALLFSGLIALLMSRRIMTAGEYIGGALSAVGLLCLVFFFLFRSLAGSQWPCGRCPYPLACDDRYR